MPISMDAVKNLLGVLEEKYPAAIGTSGEITAPAINSKDIPALLQFCYEEGWIECKISETVGGQRYYDIIKITSKGIRFLRGF